MKKIISVFGRALFFSCIVLFSIFIRQLSFVWAEKLLWPQGDFDLIYGMYRIPNSSDPAPIDKDYRILFVFYPLSIRDGKISNIVNHRTNFSYTLGAQNFNGDGIIEMDGEYNKETGKISGSYKIETNVSNTHKLGGGGKYESVESGTFQGQIINGHVVLNFSCKKSSGEWYSKSPNGKEESGTIDKCVYFINKVSYMVAPIAKIESTAYKQGPTEAPKKYVDSGVRVAGMTGQCDIEIDGVRRPLKMDDVIPVDAHIITEEDSKIILSFVDMSTFVVESESHIVISAPAEKESKLKLVVGNMWANIKQMVKDGTMEVEMNQAVAGIKGTTFACEEKDGKSILKVFEGAVEFKSKASGETVQVKGGEKVVADTKGLSPTEQFDTFEEVQSLMKFRNEENINWEEGEGKEEKSLPLAEKAESKKEKKVSTRWLLIGEIIIILAVGIFTGLNLIKKIKK